MNCRTNGPEVFTNKQVETLPPAPPPPPLDRRVQRTRQLLREALFLLIVERGYEPITIQDITERANLGRTTFYLHYQDKEELLKASLKSLLQDLQLEVEPLDEESCPHLERCIRIFHHIAQRPQLYQALLRENGTVNISNLLRDYFGELFKRHLLAAATRIAGLSETTSALIAAHAAGALIGLVAWWLDQTEGFPAERMGAVYFQLMSKGSENVFSEL